MSAELLVREFDRAIEASGSVDLLRGFVLDLAVRGRLVPQDSHEQPALDQLERIGISALALSDIQPYPAPPGWSWAHLGDFMRHETESVDSTHEPNTQFCLWSVPSYFDGRPELVVGRDLGSSKRRIALGDILLSKINPHLNRVWLTGGFDNLPQIASSEWLVINPRGVSRPLLKYFLTSPYFLAEFSSILTGIGGSLRRVRPTDARAKRIPIPPRAEQDRIVAKVDELMALCDQLEAAQTEREARRDRLRAASLHRLAASDGEAKPGSADVRFFLDTSPRLITKPEHIAALREAILDLAVRGRLLPRANLWNGKPDYSRDLAPVTGSFKVPTGWRWLSVAQIGTARLGKMLDKAKNRGVPHRYLRNVNVRWFGFDLSDVKTMLFDNDELSQFALRPGDVLICEGGEPGRAAVWDARETDIYFQKAIHRVRLYDWVVPQFFVLYLRARAYAGGLIAHSTGATFHHLTGQGLASLPVPIPPPDEQHNIVAKVEELMVLCDHLEAALASAQDGRARLLEALVHEALEGGAVRNSVEMGTAV